MRASAGERELHLGQVYGVNPQQLPSAVQYIALGHLHRPQEVLAPAKTRYPGSLIELDFGEQEQEKSVVVLDAQAQRPPGIELVEVTAGRRLRTVEGTFAELAHLADLRSDDYLRVRVKAEAPTPGLADRVKELLPNALDVTVDYPRDAGRNPSAARAAASLPRPSSSSPTTSTATRPFRRRSYSSSSTSSTKRRLK